MFIDWFGLTIPDLYCKSWLSVVSATLSILNSNDPFPVVAERGEKSAVNQREIIETRATYPVSDRTTPSRSEGKA